MGGRNCLGSGGDWYAYAASSLGVRVGRPATLPERQVWEYATTLTGRFPMPSKTQTWTCLRCNQENTGGRDSNCTTCGMPRGLLITCYDSEGNVFPLNAWDWQQVIDRKNAAWDAVDSAGADELSCSARSLAALDAWIAAAQRGDDLAELKRLWGVHKEATDAADAAHERWRTCFEAARSAEDAYWLGRLQRAAFAERVAEAFAEMGARDSWQLAELQQAEAAAVASDREAAEAERKLAKAQERKARAAERYATLVRPQDQDA